MDLQRAIKRVVKACPSTRDDSVFKAIRLCSRTDHDPARVWATNGRWGVVVPVAGDLPDVLLESVLLKTASAEAGTGELCVEELGYGKIVLKTEISTYTTQALPFELFPELPPVPESFSEELDFDQVLGVVHAAQPIPASSAKSAPDPGLECLKFTSEFVEATDKYRLSRVYQPLGWEGLVQASVFKGWPKKKRVFSGSTLTHAFFVVDGETRFTPFSHEAYPHTNGLVPRAHYGPSCLIETKPLTVAVKQAVLVSPLGLVQIDFWENMLGLLAWEQEQEGPRTYVAQVALSSPMPQDPVVGSVVVNGKYVYQALQDLKTPCLRLGWGDRRAPLRIDAGQRVECVWQVVV